MSLGTYIRTRRGAAIFAVLLALLARVAINARWEFEAGFPESRTWVLLTIPFRLLEHTQYFWLEAALMLGVAVLVMGLTRNFTARGPACLDRPVRGRRTGHSCHRGDSRDRRQPDHRGRGIADTARELGSNRRGHDLCATAQRVQYRNRGGRCLGGLFHSPQDET